MGQTKVSTNNNDKPSQYLVNHWIVFVSTNIMMLLLNSLAHAFGALFPYILAEFGENRAVTATIQSVFFGVGLCSGSGLSFLELSANQAASQCFSGRTRMIALSVVNSAAGIGAMGYPYILSWFYNTVGLEGTFLLLSGITMNGIPISFLWIQEKRHRSTVQKTLQMYILEMRW